jgi:alpha-1,3-rhamnosyl/mannosyltransferase
MKHKFVLDTSNISTQSDKMMRTGIQEVVYQTFLHLIAVKSEFPDIEFVCLPILPRRSGDLLSSEIIASHPEIAPGLLEEVEDRLRLPSKSIWGFDLRGDGFKMSDERPWNLMADADFVHLQGLINCAPLVSRLKNRRGNKRTSVSMTIYDLIPVTVPEYCSGSISRWYNGSYLPGMGRFVDHAVCISRHTALDLLEHPATRHIPTVSVLSLPFDFPSAASPNDILKSKFNIKPLDYVLFLGSVEPRKNLIGLLDGFECYRLNNPEAETKLVVVGPVGWKNGPIERRIQNSSFLRDIIRTGYLNDSDLRLLIEQAGCLAMLSHYEGYGLPAAQAYSKGVSVLVTYGTSLPEACGGRGYFVSPWDIYSVAGGLSIALREAQENNRQTPDLARSRTWGAYTRNLIKLIKSPNEARELGQWTTSREPCHAVNSY